MTERTQKLIKAAELLLPQAEREAELDKLVAASMLTGSELGKLAAKPDEKE